MRTCPALLYITCTAKVNVVESVIALQTIFPVVNFAIANVFMRRILIHGCHIFNSLT